MSNFPAISEPTFLDVVLEELALATDRSFAALMAALDESAPLPAWWVRATDIDALRPCLENEQTRSDMERVLRDLFNDLLVRVAHDLDVDAVDAELGPLQIVDKDHRKIAPEIHHAMFDLLAITRRDLFVVADPAWKF
jgi:hypothetical protein